MTRSTQVRLALAVAGTLFGSQGLLLVSGADVPHPTGHAVFAWGYVATAVALVLLARSARTDLASAGAALGAFAAVFAVLVAIPVLAFEGIGAGSTPGPLHALEAGTFLVYPAIAASGLALVRQAATRVLGALLLAGLLLDVAVAPWAFGACAVLAAVLPTTPRSPRAAGSRADDPRLRRQHAATPAPPARRRRAG